MTEQAGTQTPVAASTPAPAVTPAPVEPQAQPVEKMLPQSQVNELIGRNKADAYEKGRRDALAELQKQQPAPAAQPQTVGGIQQQTPEDIRKMIAEEGQRLQREDAVRNFAQQFEQKVNQGQTKYGKEFDTVLRDIDLPQIARVNPAFITMLGNVDNTADVLKELHGAPEKLSTLLNLAANPGTQNLAQAKVMALSDSIKNNEAAQKQPTAPEPLGQIKPSPTGADNGQMNIRDYRKAPWLKG